MRISRILLAVLVLFSTVALAQNLTEIVTEPAGTGLELLTSWQALAIMAVIISVIFVAMAYAIGIGFEMPEMQAWARTELGQIFTNVIIIAFLLGITLFVDMYTMSIINNSGVGSLQCAPTENCLKKVSVAYLADYIDTGRGGAKNVLDGSVTAAGWMNRRVGIYSSKLLPWLMAGGTTTIAAQYVLDFDRYGIIFQYYQGVLSSLEAQKFFIEQICFKVAPLILALGIVARSFFVTRRLGGLLMAIAISVMVFFPMMYVFAWMSLEIASTGDLGTYAGPDDCPEECSSREPVAYYGSTSLTNLTELYNLFDEEDFNNVAELAQGEIEYLQAKEGQIVYSCDFNTNCNRTCRELPYPASNSMCANISVQKACAKLPEQCKVIRIVPEAGIDQKEYDSCPDICKVIPPMASNCDNGKCLESRFDCRVAKNNDLNWRPTMEKVLKGKERCDWASQCRADGTDAYDNCVWILPETGLCDDLCLGCPDHCRLNVTDTAGLPGDCKNSTTGELLPACKDCNPTCKAQVNQLDAGLCTGCPLHLRLIGDGLGMEYITGACDIGEDVCPYNETYRAAIPFAACESCIFSEEPYEYKPPIRRDCAQLCKPSMDTPSKKAGDYANIDGDGLVGKTEIKNISKLMVPAYLLPLLNIAMTLMLIRSLSGILGGDIEIPGLSKIF